MNKYTVGMATQGLANYILKNVPGENHSVCISFDSRNNSAEFARITAHVLANNGISVWLYDRLRPIPLLSFAVRTKKATAGVMITASHNPSEYNGIKLIVDEGRDAPLETTALLEELISGIDNAEYKEFETAVADGEIVYLSNPFNKFLDDIIGLLDMNALRERGLRVVFDTMHGSGTYPLLVIFHTARCTIDAININKDAYFGGLMPAPSEKSLGLLRDTVIKGGYDLGIAMDGDGDRLGVIDRNGRYINANEILCMLYYYLVKYKGWKGPVVRNLATTHMLDRIAESFGEKCYEVPVGFKYISAKIDEADAVLGGESSGGLTVRGHIHGKDSVYAASLFAEMISVVGKSASDIMDELEREYGKFVMVEDNLRFAPEYKSVINKIVFEEKKLPEFAVKVDHVNYEDGCKVYFKDGSWVICRFSGTEPLLRMAAEADEQAEAERCIWVWRMFLGL